MDEYINRTELLKLPADVLNWGNPYGYSISTIKQFPVEDVVSVVRCMDCEHLELHSNLEGIPFCRVWQNIVWPDEFCRRGKSRKNSNKIK